MASPIGQRWPPRGSPVEARSTGDQPNPLGSVLRISSARMLNCASEEVAERPSIRYQRFRKAPVAQLDRALPSEGKGHTFESCRVRHFGSYLRTPVPVFSLPAIACLSVDQLYIQNNYMSESDFGALFEKYSDSFNDAHNERGWRYRVMPQM
jgi:hypothetical protein